jgi:diguanylate cyclase
MSAAKVANPITEVMRHRRVAPLPRNYELFYEALLGPNKKLSAELAALGVGPIQEQLDDLFAKYVSKAGAANKLEGAEESLSAQIDALKTLLAREGEAMQDHGRSLAGFKASLVAGNPSFPDDLGNSIKAIHSKTRDAIATHASVIDDATQSAADLQAMRQQLNEYKRLAYLDSLTGLFNRRAFDERLGAFFEARGLSAGSALILADIDHFKRFNDSYGQPVGDKVLIAVAQVLMKQSSRNIFAARPGGEEFALLVQNVTLAEAQELADVVRRAVVQIRFEPQKGGKVIDPITISLGISMRADASSSAEFYENSDLALYSAKSGGRNCAHTYSSQLRGAFAKDRMIYRDAG